MLHTGPPPESGPLRIGFRVGTFPKLSETFILSQIEGLVERGHHVSILADQRPAEGEAAKVPPGLLSVRYVRPRHDLAAGIFSRLPYRVRKFLTTRSERRFCKDNDVVISNFGWFGAQMHASARGLTNPPRLITIFHGDDMSRALLKSGHVDYSSLIASGSPLLPISEFWRTRLLDLGAREAHTIVHHMGVNLDTFEFKPPTRQHDDRLKLVTVCRFVEKKGLEYTIRALAKAREQRPDATIELDLIGSGPLRKELEQLVEALGLGGAVTFRGALPHQQVATALRQADALILPSVVSSDGDMEGIPMSLMEAMASGIGVISTYHSGIPELITHGTSGLLAQERDTDELAEHILTFMKSPEQARKMAVNARKIIETKFNNRLQNDKLEAVCYGHMREPALMVIK